MNHAAVAVVALLACAGSGVLAALRWLRVAQREHYLPGATTRFARRWWTASISERAAGAVALAAAVTSALVAPMAIVAAVVVGAGPRGLGVRGRTSRLTWTRRARTVAVLLGIAAFALVAGAAALGGGERAAVPAAALVVVLLPVLVDAVLFVLAPVEARLARRFVDEASAQLARVGPRVVAITGSYGKTTTKGYVAHLLADRFTVVASPRSFNNRAGLARTVNELLVPGSDVLVAEMGAYGPGEIAGLCSWLVPEIAVITAVGPVHLERFKTLERTLAAKSEITDRANTSVLNVDDERLAGLAARLRGEGRRVVCCSGKDPDADVAVLRVGGRLAVYRSGSCDGEVAGSGEAQAGARSNIACALAAAFALGCDAPELLRRLASLPVAPHRLDVATAANGVVVLDDTFNANPAGASLALIALEMRAPAGPDARRVLVTPGMVELGPLQAQENAAFGFAAAKVVTDAVIVGRTNRRSLAEGFAAGRAEGYQVEVRFVATRDAAVELLRGELRAGDAVLYENDLPDHFP